MRHIMTIMIIYKKSGERERLGDSEMEGTQFVPSNKTDTQTEKEKV